jgi:hypothetical protein
LIGSGCSLVLVDHAAEDPSSPYCSAEWDDDVRLMVWWTLVEALVWTVPIVATRKSHVVSELVKEVRRMSKA